MQFTLLNTRPAHQSASLNELVMQAGGQAMNCPTLKIEPKLNALEPLKILCEQTFDKVIFISANAVEQFVKQNAQEKLTTFTHATKWYAIGKATAKKARQFDMQLQTLSKTQFDSEAFLASSVMQAASINGSSILIVKGEGGRDLLEKSLSKRGAKVACLELYSRQPVEFCRATWTKFIKQPEPVLLVSSLASWEVIYRAINALTHEPNELDLSETLNAKDKGLPKKLLTVVMSQRIAFHIQEQNWPYAVKVIDEQTNAGIIKSIQQELCL